MAPARRLGSYIIVSAIILYTLWRFSTSTSEPELQPYENSHATLDTNIGGGATKPLTPEPALVPFTTWKDLPIRNPVERYIPYPARAPQKLPRVQYNFRQPEKIELELRERRQAEVKKTFKRCWDAYVEKAWLKDELDPVSGNSKETFGGWAATLIDALDTLWIMDMKEEFKMAVDAVDHIDFSRSRQEIINVFETTIRHLGGLLAAYDLSKETVLLDKAIEVADMLYAAFDTPNRMPITRWDWARAASQRPQRAASQALVAEIGSLTMEFTRLTQVTGDPKWYDAVARIVDVIEAQQNKTLLPGMWPIVINAEVQDFTKDNAFTLAAMADSLYEYNPKMHALMGGVDSRYETMHKVAMDTAIKYTIFRPMTPENADILVSGFLRVQEEKVQLDAQLQHLVCFTGGMFALGGKLFELDEHITIGQKLTDACIWAYKAFPYGIMPEVSHLVACPSRDSCTWDEQAWHAEVRRRAYLDEKKDVTETIAVERLPKGFAKVQDRRYILRPEAIESVFIMYRITGEQSMQAAAWDMFQAIEKYTKTDIANSALKDVTASDAIAAKDNGMESFWMAETLKYFYLVFSDPSLISLDEYVFNTEAHPFKRPA